MYLADLNAEAPATRKCLERIPENLFDWKPHDKSMKMGYLAQVIAEIPRWVTMMVETGEIDLATFKHVTPKTTAELVSQFDENLKGAEKALRNVSDGELAKPFELKAAGKVLSTSSRKSNIRFALRHLAHHRGQLTVYMRLKEISVPSIYGPSADEKGEF